MGKGDQYGSGDNHLWVERGLDQSGPRGEWLGVRQAQWQSQQSSSVDGMWTEEERHQGQVEDFWSEQRQVQHDNFLKWGRLKHSFALFLVLRGRVRGLEVKNLTWHMSRLRCFTQPSVTVRQPDL